MEGMCLKLTPMVVRRLLGYLLACLNLWLALHGLIASPNGPNGGFGPPLACHLPHNYQI